MLFLIRYLMARTLFSPLEGLERAGWHRLRRAEGDRTSWRYLPKVALLEAQTAWQTHFARRVDRDFGRRIAAARVAAPVFILGHYRSGTTHLHELMDLDPRFASPTRFQAYHPASFLATEPWFARFNDFLMLPRRVQEDEIALMNLTGESPYLDWCFPESDQDYARFLTFRRATQAEVDAWKHELDWYLRALTVRYAKPILLKSPPHTARMRLILEVFPDARFVHIRRDPYAVFVSTARLLRDIDPVFRLWVRQEPIDPETILATYREMYDQFFEDIPHVPPGQLTEIAYEDLEAEPEAQLARIYSDLDLGDFEAVRPTVRAYLQSIANYQKNRHPKIDPETRATIARRWSREFEAWGYPT